MSIATLFDHRVVVYRAGTARDELQDVVETWEPLTAPVGKNARPNQGWSGALQDHGPGQQQGAMRQWFLQKAFDVAERDVLAVEEGPEAGLRLKVESVTRPTAPLLVHHLEVNVTVWPGSLTVEAEES